MHSSQSDMQFESGSTMEVMAPRQQRTSKVGPERARTQYVLHAVIMLTKRVLRQTALATYLYLDRSQAKFAPLSNTIILKVLLCILDVQYQTFRSGRPRVPRMAQWPATFVGYISSEPHTMLEKRHDQVKFVTEILVSEAPIALLLHFPLLTESLCLGPNVVAMRIEERSSPKEAQTIRDDHRRLRCANKTECRGVGHIR